MALDLFDYDLLAGCAAAAIIAAYTFGSIGASYRFGQQIVAMEANGLAVAGGYFSIWPNMLWGKQSRLLGYIAFPIERAGRCWWVFYRNYFLNPQGNPNLLALFVVLVVALLSSRPGIFLACGGCQGP